MTLQELLEKIDRFQEFARFNRINGNGFTLGNHQLVPIYDAVYNNLQRFLLAYATSAGKTVIPLEIIKLLKKQGKPHKTIVVAPYQTVLENWNSQVLEQAHCQVNIHTISNSTTPIPDDTEFLVVNYDKIPDSRSYQEQLINFARSADILIPDECHNIKNRKGKTSQGLQNIVEVMKDKRMIALSATPVPDRIKDMGIILYLLDPLRYQHYRHTPFVIEEDREAIWEMKESGKIRFFTRDQVAKFYNLPPYVEHDPKKVDMSEEHAERYFQAFKNCFLLGTSLYSLERASIEAMIHAEQTKEVLRQRLQEGHTLNLFSHLRNPPKDGSQNQGIFFQLEQMLREIGAKNIYFIHGNTSGDERLRIQRLMAEGHIDALINQWGCTQEGFSEVAGNRPVTIVPLRSPFSPGTQLQLVGRSFRKGQNALVEYMEFHPDSQELRQKIDRYVRSQAKKQGVRVKASWSPTLFHEDAYQIRLGKERTIKICLNTRAFIESDDPKLNINSLASYSKSLSRNRILDSSESRDIFGKGPGFSIKYVGVDYEDGLKPNAGFLGDDYNREDILIYTPGKINLFLAKAVEELKEASNKKESSWKIADLGCCSSAPFAQARIIWQALQIANGHSTGLDNIVNVDGVEGFVNNASEFIRDREWCEVVHKFEGDDVFGMKESYKYIKDMNFSNISFLRRNFVKEDFGKNYDVIITSQCLQYNDQTEQRDIEKIIIRINNSLKLGGHYLSALTSNTFTKSFTTENDVNNFRKILESYGFEVKELVQIEGRNGKEIVLKPFYYVHAVKIKECKELLNFDQPLPMYSSYKEVLTGGYKVEPARKSSGKKEFHMKSLPSRFVNKNGEEFKFLK